MRSIALLLLTFLSSVSIAQESSSFLENSLKSTPTNLLLRPVPFQVGEKLNLNLPALASNGGISTRVTFLMPTASMMSVCPATDQMMSFQGQSRVRSFNFLNKNFTSSFNYDMNGLLRNAELSFDLFRQK